jgi:hypothetical protein
MRFLRDYALGVVLLVLFISAWALQWLTHVGSFPEFINATMENWQSEFLQLLLAVVLPTYLLFRRSPQSRDGSDKIEADIEDVKRLQLQLLAKLEDRNR